MNHELVFGIVTSFSAIASVTAAVMANRTAKKSFQSAEVFNRFQEKILNAEVGKDYRLAMSEIEKYLLDFDRYIIQCICINIESEKHKSISEIRLIDSISFNHLCKNVVDGLNTISVANGNQYNNVIRTLKILEQCYDALYHQIRNYCSDGYSKVIAEHVFASHFKNDTTQKKVFVMNNGEAIEKWREETYMEFNKTMKNNNNSIFETSTDPEIKKFVGNLSQFLSDYFSSNTKETNQLQKVIHLIQQYIHTKESIFSKNWIIPNPDTII